VTTSTQRPKRLYKNPDDRVIAGVASGIAKYFDLDPALVRVLWAATILVGGLGLLVYVILWIVLEDEPPEMSEELTEAEPETEEDAELPVAEIYAEFKESERTGELVEV
jgi:phage shock protein C